MKNTKDMSRSRFLGFLGKIGLLSIIPAVHAHAAGVQAVILEKSEEKTELREIAKPAMLKIRSPKIKGKMLSSEALEAKLATKNLENIRDLMTGRFFGKAAERVFKNGYTPLINWSLGSEDADTGCLLFAELGTPDSGFRPVDKCTAHVLAIEGLDGINIFMRLGTDTSGPGAVSAGDCVGYCGAVCTWYNLCPKASNFMDFTDFISNPGDKFVSEITEILGSKEIGVIQSELRNVIFSDEVLNLGLQYFVLGAHDAMVEGVEEAAAGI